MTDDFKNHTENVLTETVFKEMVAHVTNSRVNYSKMTPLEGRLIRGTACNLGDIKGVL